MVVAVEYISKEESAGVEAAKHGVTGILAVQGAFAEHAAMLDRLGAPWKLLRAAEDFDDSIDRVILPGGESTTQGKLLRSTGLSGDQVKSEFTAGRLAVYPSGSWDIDSFNETGLNYGFGQIPMLKKGDTPYAPGSIDPAFGINNKISGDKLKAAEKFFTFLTSDEGLKLYQKQLGLIPSVKGFNATVDDHFKDAYDLYIKTGNVYLNSAHWSKGTTALRAETFTQLQQVALGSISPTQAAENLDSKLKTLS